MSSLTVEDAIVVRWPKMTAMEFCVQIRAEMAELLKKLEKKNSYSVKDCLLNCINDRNKSR